MKYKYKIFIVNKYTNMIQYQFTVYMINNILNLIVMKTSKKFFK